MINPELLISEDARNDAHVSIVVKGSLKLRNWANCDKCMKFSTVNLYTIQFILRCGAILDLICDDLEGSMTLHG